jgi:hypothetical protein
MNEVYKIGVTDRRNPICLHEQNWNCTVGTDVQRMVVAMEACKEAAYMYVSKGA